MERTQKLALILIYQSEYESYPHALSLSGLSDLRSIRRKLMEVFAVRCIGNEKTRDMFPLNVVSQHTRAPETYKVPFASHECLKSSAIPIMARYLNSLH